MVVIKSLCSLKLEVTWEHLSVKHIIHNHNQSPGPDHSLPSTACMHYCINSTGKGESGHSMQDLLLRYWNLDMNNDNTDRVMITFLYSALQVSCSG